MTRPSPDTIYDLAHVILAKARVLAADKVGHNEAVTSVLELASTNRGAMERALAHCQEVYEHDPHDAEAKEACATVSDALSLLTSR
jgi:hypothetical protein